MNEPVDASLSYVFPNDPIDWMLYRIGGMETISREYAVSNAALNGDLRKNIYRIVHIHMNESHHELSFCVLLNFPNV